MQTSIRRVSVHHLKPGMILANALFSETNSLLVAEKTRLTDTVIDRILNSNVHYADILIILESEIAADFAKGQQILIGVYFRTPCFSNPAPN